MDTSTEPHRAFDIDDIIFRIIDALHLNDLCSFSLTCKRIRALSENYFERKYAKTKYLIIVQNSHGIQFIDSEKYPSYFMANIQNVILRGQSSTSPSIDLLHYLHQNCGRNLKEIRFEFIHFRDEFGACIQDSISNIETVSFTSCKIDGNIYQKFLKYCPNVKTLNFCRNAMDDGQIWLTGDCPMLDAFHLRIRRKSDCIYWERFFRDNPNVMHMQTICLEGDHPIMRPMCTVIIEKAIHLKRLCLAVSEDFDTNAIDGELGALASNGKCELGLEFDGNHTEDFIRNIKHVSMLKNLTELYFDSVVINEEFFKAISKLKNLKTLNLDNIELVSMEQIQKLGKKYFPNNLEELFIGYFSRPRRMMYIITLFLAYSAKLSTIILYSPALNYDFSILSKFLSHNNEVRKENGQKVNIFYWAKLHQIRNLFRPQKDDLFDLHIISEIGRYNFFKRNPFIQFSHPDCTALDLQYLFENPRDE